MTAPATEPVAEARPVMTIARLDPQKLIATAIEGGAEIGVLERLFALAKDYKAEQAKEAFYAAKAAFFKECPPIKKLSTAKITTKSGGHYSYNYTELGDIGAIVNPILGKFGLSVSWKAPKLEAGKVVVCCILAHELGHSEESGDIELPVDTSHSDRGANPAQRVGAAITYASRYALMMVLGIATVDDDDARSAGGYSEERGEERHEDPAPTREDQPRGNGGNGGAVISEAQERRFWAIARQHNWTEAQTKTLVNDYNHDHSYDILRTEYEEMVNKLKAGPKK